MFHQFLLGLTLLSFSLPLTSGCQTQEPVIWSAAHNKRHALRVIAELEDTWVAIDRVFFDIEDLPGQDAGDHFRREGMAILHGLHGFHMDVDSVIFDMPEYPLETEY